MSTEDKGSQLKIVLFGHFGGGNFGNESTLRAMLQNAARLVPDAELSCICSIPEVVSAEYEIATVPISGVVVKPWNLQNPVVKIIRKGLIGIPSEIYRWLQGLNRLRDTNMLIVVGTGLLTDAFGIGAWGPYSVFKWSAIAKLCGCRLIFVSVGAGPVESQIGRMLVRSALRFADFRSYRDEATWQYVKKLGIRADGDRVYPDLAFSLPTIRPNMEKEHRRVVGIGLMSYAGMYGIEKTTKAHYAAYVEALVHFSSWVLKRGYDVRLLYGDIMDFPTMQEFQSLLRGRVESDYEGRVILEPVTSVQDLLSQLAATDFVIATRFHNVLLALLLNKPSIAISFHHKCSSLMKQTGLADYCHDIKSLDPHKLIERFCDLESDEEKLKALIKSRVEEFRATLNEQYWYIFRQKESGSVMQVVHECKMVAETRMTGS
jgi:polysaccharide pyruvyl transferase WcaK-like protein